MFALVRPQRHRDKPLTERLATAEFNEFAVRERPFPVLALVGVG
jgi:hypothetical protein